MRAPLTLAVAQPRLVSLDVAENAAAHAVAVRDAKARVVVFPELSLTGYELKAPVLSPDDPRLAPLVEACGESGSLALVGAPLEGEAGRAHIAMLAVTGAGAIPVYRKLYPGAAEARRFSPGLEPGVLEIDGWRIGLAICRDTGIRRHAEDTVALGIDVYAAGVVESAEEAHLLEERARRISTEHRVWVAVASFAGSTGEGYTRAAGGSALWGPGGVLLGRAGTETGVFVRATLAGSDPGATP